MRRSSSDPFHLQLIDSYGQLSRYHDKYKTRLTAKNLLAIKQLLDVQINLLRTLCCTCVLETGMDLCFEFVSLAKENLPTIYDSDKWSQLAVSSTSTGFAPHWTVRWNSIAF